MANVKWIKIVTDIFDDEKILLIESLPDAYAIIVVWFKLLCLAGKQNNSGVFMMGRIAYTEKMLATIFRMKESTVTMALQTFEQFGMIEIIDGVITIPNWGKHQNLDQLESRKEYMRGYMKEYREKQKQLTTGKPSCKTNSKVNVSEAEGDIEEDIDRDIDIEEEEEEEEETAGKRPAPSASVPYESIKNLYNEICKSFPRCTVMSDARKKAVKARFSSGYTLEDFKALFTKAEASSFLKGKNDRSWTANFDWLIKDANMAKVMDGNYDNSSGHGHYSGGRQSDGFETSNPFMEMLNERRDR